MKEFLEVKGFNGNLYKVTRVGERKAYFIGTVTECESFINLYNNNQAELDYSYEANYKLDEDMKRVFDKWERDIEYISRKYN